nr:gliding motility lipoprotein GldH [Ulvibacter litoralis]
MRSSIAIIFFLVVLVSCDSKTVVSEMQAMPDVWNKDNVVSFQIPQLDSLQKYDVFLHLRNTNSYKFNNLFLIVSMEFPHGKTITDTLEYRMANPDGTWLGTGIGSVKESKLWYKEQVSFLEEGTYTLSIGHAVRNNGTVEGVTNLEGITDVGFSIEETSQQ